MENALRNSGARVFTQFSLSAVLGRCMHASGLGGLCKKSVARNKEYLVIFYAFLN